jgi:glycerol uptake facilitator-like aquaporin
MLNHSGATTYAAYSSLIMFLTFVISGQLSGGQGNPIITIALLFMKGSNVTLLNSIIYIVTQFVGAIVGGAIGIIYFIFFIGYGSISNFVCAIPLVNTPRTFGGELLGSLLFVIMYLIIISASTKFENNFWAYITVPCAFFISKM